MTTHTKWMHKLDFPSIDWPIADFPQTRYPVSGNTAQNRREEARCLQQVNSGKQPLGVAGNHLQFCYRGNDFVKFNNIMYYWVICLNLQKIEKLRMPSTMFVSIMLKVFFTVLLFSNSASNISASCL